MLQPLLSHPKYGSGVYPAAPTFICCVSAIQRLIEEYHGFRGCQSLGWSPASFGEGRPPFLGMVARQFSPGMVARNTHRYVNKGVALNARTVVHKVALRTNSLPVLPLLSDGPWRPRDACGGPRLPLETSLWRHLAVPGNFWPLALLAGP